MFAFNTFAPGLIQAAIGVGAMALLRHLKTTGFRPISKVRTYRTPTLKVC